MEFNNLSTVRFQEKMKPAAYKIYNNVFPECKIIELRGDDDKVHTLDKSFGIDLIIELKGGQIITLQEKYRKNDALRYLDFTQEYMNAVGTNHESKGEWFNLCSQLYFYGWSDKAESCFEKWFLMDIVKYKLLVNSLGGLDKIGTLKQNNFHGRASFYAIPAGDLAETFITDYSKCKR